MSDEHACAPRIHFSAPLKQYEIFAAGTLVSVRAQTYPNWDLVAVDDCSTDKLNP
jgi:glycosyltransferase involved in cell wall biosynthesis